MTRESRARHLPTPQLHDATRHTTYEDTTMPETTTTRRYTLIDADSGYVWGDAIASTPAEACRLVDEDAGSAADRSYVEHGPRSRPTLERGGYYVYETPEALGDDVDGQDAATIARVESWPLVAIVEIVRAHAR